MTSLAQGLLTLLTFDSSVAERGTQKRPGCYNNPNNPLYRDMWQWNEAHSNALVCIIKHSANGSSSSFFLSVIFSFLWLFAKFGNFFFPAECFPVYVYFCISLCLSVNISECSCLVGWPSSIGIYPKPAGSLKSIDWHQNVRRLILMTCMSSVCLETYEAHHHPFVVSHQVVNLGPILRIYCTIYIFEIMCFSWLCVFISNSCQGKIKTLHFWLF